MLRPFWQRKPVWLRMVLFAASVVGYMAWAACEGAYRYMRAMWEEVAYTYEELLTTPMSDK